MNSRYHFKLIVIKNISTISGGDRSNKHIYGFVELQFITK